MKRAKSNGESGSPWILQFQSQSESQIPNEEHEKLPSSTTTYTYCQDEEVVEAVKTFGPGLELAVTEAEVENGSESEPEEEKDEEEDEREDEEGGGRGGHQGEEEGDTDGEMEEQVQVQVRAKLAEDFYEIEAVRKKRIFKGEPQYLIKWRGWPESSNTWEPLEHLQTCPDVVEAFEESLLSRQKRTYRKRKHKFTQPKKKGQYSYGGSRSLTTSVKLPLSDEVQSSAQLNSSNPANLCPSFLPSTSCQAVELDEDLKKQRLARKTDEDGSRNLCTVGNKDNNDDDISYDENVSVRKLSVHFQEPMTVEGDSPEIFLSKVDGKKSGQNDRCTGAKRRKSGSVRRFKQGSTSVNPSYIGNATLNFVTSYDRMEQLMAGNNNGFCRDDFDFSQSGSVITRIIKPISYSASVLNNNQDVSVTFVAMRADGKEVVIDNKFLKANNPLLLINFYEQHLRYSPTS
ncbi:hypothetical protein Nepgr_025634 [Nepenthes gracilis]|uniref:Chromo domain-containing protein n=1 Tax=Nepenthes gracilis TaxID=150966 RepID=A0AAD3Y1Q2_NEPGR|nr:hypothetical protein Nepgr_025634 [Nepenthes gracilis]